MRLLSATFCFPLDYVGAIVRLANPAPIQAMHQGVVRDMEQQRLKKERQLDFDMQRALEEEYKKGQTVHETTAEMDEGGSRGRGR